MPVFTVSFCAVILVIFILDNFFLIPKSESVTRKEMFFGHNKGYINRALRLSETKIKNGQVWRLFSSALLHVGVPHVVTNTAATLIVGYAVESELGWLKTMICYVGSALVSGLFMAFVYKLDEGEGASPGIFGLIAVFLILAVKHGTVFFSNLPLVALIILAVYIVTGIITNKTVICEHLSGFVGGMLTGLLIVCFG